MTRILVANDQPDLVDAIEMILEDAGYAVQVVLGGEAALKHAIESPPDLIILDWLMPDIAGSEVLRRIRSVGPSNVPVLMMSASPEAAAEARRYGADGFLPKPFDDTELVRAVERILNSRKASRAA